MRTRLFRFWAALALLGVLLVLAGALVHRFVAVPLERRAERYDDRAVLQLAAGQSRNVWAAAVNNRAVECAVETPQHERISLQVPRAQAMRYDGRTYLKVGEVTATTPGSYTVTCSRPGYAGWGPVVIRVSERDPSVSRVASTALLATGGVTLVAGLVGAIVVRTSDQHRQAGRAS